jgi:hypothetical protein
MSNPCGGLFMRRPLQLFTPATAKIQSTPTLIERIDQALQERGWRYDVRDEQFMVADREIEWEELIDLLPDLTLDELAAYQDVKPDVFAGERR